MLVPARYDDVRFTGANLSGATREGRTSEPFQHGESWGFVLVESATTWNSSDLVLEHHRQQLMFDCHG